MIELLSDPAAWFALLTLVILEIVLGIDNLIFIAILADKLPPHQRDRARIIGLSLALVMRLGLLSVVSWLVTLTDPLFTILTFDFSGRDVILLFGGIFLLFKATAELHDRLEGGSHAVSTSKAYASFGAVVAQIVVLDAVFSLDAVITAVGMVDELPIMFAAVVISIAVMLLASKPLTRFVNAHPTVVILCLGFLLMIGLTLIADGFGYHLPKGYLYGAIGFSIVIEFFNQWSNRNVIKQQARRPLRERTAESVWRLMGGRRQSQAEHAEDGSGALQEEPAFGHDERNMVSGVLTMAERPVRSIMTPRADMSWIDLNAEPDTLRRQILATPHNSFLVCRGQMDTLLGVGRGKDLMGDLGVLGKVDEVKSLYQPVVLPESANVLRVMEALKRTNGQLVLIADEFGTLQGLVTPIDILEAIAGEFPDEDEQPAVQAEGPGRWRVDGATDLQYLEQILNTDVLTREGDPYSSIAGFLLERFSTLPDVGQTLEFEGFKFEVAQVRDRRIACVRVSRVNGNVSESS